MDSINKFIENISQNIFLEKSIRVILTVLLTIILKMIVDKLIVNRINKKMQDNKNSAKINTILSIFNNIIKTVIYFVAITHILSIFNINTGSILAVAGIGGMAIAFASKSIIEDVISGAFILIENQYNIGDVVTIGSTTGTVTEIGLRITKLVDIDGKEIIVPNGTISIVTNHSINDMRAAVMVHITGNSDYNTIMKILKKACDEVVKKSDSFVENPSIIGVENFTDFGYQVLIQAKTKNSKQFEVQRLLREEIIKNLQKENIDFSNVR